MIILTLCQKLQHLSHLIPPPPPQQKHTYTHILLLPSSPSARSWKTQTRSWSSSMFDAFLNSSGLPQVSGQRKDLICCNLISGQNHTAYLSNIKHLPFSLSGHLAKNREKRVLLYFLYISPHLQSFHLALKRQRFVKWLYALILKKRECSSAIKRVEVLLGGKRSCRRTFKALGMSSLFRQLLKIYSNNAT